MYTQYDDFQDRIKNRYVTNEEWKAEYYELLYRVTVALEKIANSMERNEK